VTGTSSMTDRELVVLAGAGILLLSLVVGIEAAGAVGGLFASGHPVTLSLANAAATLARIPSHGASAAWPSHFRSWLPRDMTPPLALGALVAAGLTAVGVWVLTLLVRSDQPKAARWAKSGDLTSLRVGGPVTGRVILGRQGDRLIAAGDRASTLVMGPTQLAGKSSRVVIPALLEWQGPALNTSIKPDVLDATIGVRERLGEVKVFDPLGRTGLSTATWSPVASAGSWSQAREVAAMLMQVGWEQARLDREPHWRPAAARHLAPLLLAAHAGRRTLEQVLVWIDTIEKDEPEELLEQCPDPKAPRALENLKATWKKDPRYQSSLYATLEEGLDAWQEPSVAAATASSDITADWLLSGANTLYVVAPEKDQRRLWNLFGALLMQVIDDALQLAATRPGRRLEPPLLCALDEVANIAPIPTLGTYASAGLGPGVLLLTVLQDYSQAIEHWGSERAQSILANHTCKLFCSGIGDPATLRYIEGLLGHQLVHQVSEHRGSGSSARRSTTVQPHLEPLAPPHRVRQAAEDTALLVYGRLPPAWITLRPYYKDRSLKRIAAVGS
jgi:type IV secretion system protein VirD4